MTYQLRAERICDTEIKCLDSEISSDKYVCKYYIKSLFEEKYYYVKKCPSNYQCKSILGATLSDELTGCIYPYQKKEEGSSCGLSYECKSNFCNVNKCAIKNDGEECINHLQCSTYSICKNNRCVKASSEGEFCESNSDCMAGYACGKKEIESNNICIQMYSLKNNNFSTNKDLCESGLLNETTYKCYDTESAVPEGTSCTSSKDCKAYKIEGEKKEETTLECTCAWNKKKICEYGSRSESWKAFTSYFTKEMQNKKISSIRTKSEDNSVPTNDPTINQYYLKSLSMFYQAPTCILEFFSEGIWYKLSFLILFSYLSFIF